MEAVVHVEPRDAARRSDVGPAASNVGEDHGGPPEPLGQVAGDQADDPQVPLLSEDAEQALPFELVLADQAPGLADALPLELLAPLVELVQLLRQGPPLLLVPGAQQVEGEVRLLQAAGDVEARPQVEGDRRAVHPPLGTAGGDAQLLQAGPGAALDGLETAAHEHPVLVEEGDEVGHRSQGDEVEQVVEVAPALAGLEEGLAQPLHDLEGDPHAGQALEGVAAVPAVGVDDAVRRGQLLVLPVVVDDDHVEVLVPGELEGLEGGDAVVDGHHQVGAEAEGLDHARRLEAVAVGVAVGQEGMDPGVDPLEEVEEQGRAADAVDVVVPVDDDRLVPAQGALDALGAAVQVGEQIRAVQPFRTHVEVGEAESAAGEEGVQKGAVFPLVGQAPHRVGTQVDLCDRGRRKESLVRHATGALRGGVARI